MNKYRSTRVVEAFKIIEIVPEGEIDTLIIGENNASSKVNPDFMRRIRPEIGELFVTYDNGFSGCERICKFGNNFEKRNAKTYKSRSIVKAFKITKIEIRSKGEGALFCENGIEKIVEQRIMETLCPEVGEYLVTHRSKFMTRHSPDSFRTDYERLK